MRRDDRDLDNLIEEITVDACGDEGYWSLLEALTDDAELLRRRGRR